MAQPSPRHAHDHRHGSAPPVADFGRVVDELIEATGHEVVELHLANRPLTSQRRTDAHAQHAALRDRRVDEAIPKLFEERTEEQKRVAIAPTDVLAVDED